MQNSLVMQMLGILEVKLSQVGSGGSVSTSPLIWKQSPNRNRVKKLPICFHVNIVCCCCQTFRHMLQQGLILYTVHEQGAGKHGPRWRAQNGMAKETNSDATIAPLKRAKQPADCICKGGAVHNMAIRLNTSAPA